MIPTIISKFFFPLGMKISGQGRFYAHYSALLRQQWMTKEQIGALQWKQLSLLLQYAYDHTDFWRSQFSQKGLRPENIRTLQDMSRLPVTTKHDLQNHIDLMIDRSRSKKFFIKNASGGSTGEPTIFFQDRERNYRRAMDQIRHDQWAGWRVGEKMALLWGANYELSRYNHLIARVKNVLFFRHIPLDAFNLTRTKMLAYLHELEKRQPTVILAYGQAIALFADFLKEEGIRPHLKKLRGIISSAEKIYPHQRKRVEEFFGVPVFERYGSREVGLIASECDHFEGMHINSDNLIVECVDSSGQPCPLGSMGRIVVTDLWNMAMPMIRYDTGDVGTLIDHDCSCGRGLPLMGPLEGRSSDFMTLPDGRKIHGEYITHLFYGIKGVLQFQIIQKTLVHFVIEVVLSSEDVLKIIESKVLNNLKLFLNDPQIVIELHSVDMIMIPKSGKRRFTISYV